MGSRAPITAPGARNGGISFSRVDPITRTQTWTQSADVSSGSSGQFALSIRLKERDPSYLKPQTGGYSSTKIVKMTLRWQSNGDLSGVVKYNYTDGDGDSDNGSWFTPMIAVRDNTVRKLRIFPKEFRAAGAQIGYVTIWGYGSPANAFLGNLTVTITTVDKHPVGS